MQLIRCMNKTAFFLLLCLLSACGDKKNIPDVSKIKIDIPLQRFDKDFFSIDTTNTAAALTTLEEKYGSFMKDYLYNILGVSAGEDSTVQGVKDYIRNYTIIYDSAEKKFGNMSATEKEVVKSMQFVLYYFPDYKLPASIITFVGPVEGYSNVLTQSGIAVGLQLYLGKDFSVYQSDYVSQVYPGYQSRRFEPAYIPVNCAKNMIDEIYPPSGDNQPLVYQMIEAGKRLYLLDQFLPETADSLKTGYTQAQLQGCYKNEAFIWNYFVQNNLLFTTDIAQTRDYMTDGPYTEVLGHASPGFIGQFVGWQIIKRWLEQHKNTTPAQLISLPAKQIYDEARYKPS